MRCAGFINFVSLNVNHSDQLFCIGNSESRAARQEAKVEAVDVTDHDLPVGQPPTPTLLRPIACARTGRLWSSRAAFVEPACACSGVPEQETYIIYKLCVLGST